MFPVRRWWLTLSQAYRPVRNGPRVTQYDPLIVAELTPIMPFWKAVDNTASACVNTFFSVTWGCPREWGCSRGNTFASDILFFGNRTPVWHAGKAAVTGRNPTPLPTPTPSDCHHKTSSDKWTVSGTNTGKVPEILMMWFWSPLVSRNTAQRAQGDLLQDYVVFAFKCNHAVFDNTTPNIDQQNQIWCIWTKLL